jgi:hypothetical protein
MDKSDAGVQLRVTCQALLDTRHPDQNQADTPVVENTSHLLQPRHFETVRLVNHK